MASAVATTKECDETYLNVDALSRERGTAVAVSRMRPHEMVVRLHPLLDNQTVLVQRQVNLNKGCNEVYRLLMFKNFIEEIFFPEMMPIYISMKIQLTTFPVNSFCSVKFLADFTLVCLYAFEGTFQHFSKLIVGKKMNQFLSQDIEIYNKMV